MGGEYWAMAGGGNGRLIPDPAFGADQKQGLVGDMRQYGSDIDTAQRGPISHQHRLEKHRGMRRIAGPLPCAEGLSCRADFGAGWAPISISPGWVLPAHRSAVGYVTCPRYDWIGDGSPAAGANTRWRIGARCSISRWGMGV